MAATVLSLGDSDLVSALAEDAGAVTEHALAAETFAIGSALSGTRAETTGDTMAPHDDVVICCAIVFGDP